MNGIRQVSIVSIVGAVAFASAFAARRGREVTASPIRGVPVALGVSEDEQLRSLGYASGRQAVAYVFGSSRCGSCRRPETKSAIRALRAQMQRTNGADFKSLRI